MVVVVVMVEVMMEVITVVVVEVMMGLMVLVVLVTTRLVMGTMGGQGLETGTKRRGEGARAES